MPASASAGNRPAGRVAVATGVVVGGGVVIIGSAETAAVGSDVTAAITAVGVNVGDAAGL